MHRFVLFAILFISGCSTQISHPSQTTSFLSQNVATSQPLPVNVMKVWSTLENETVSVCKAQLPNRDHSLCKFVLTETSPDSASMNAHSWIGEGRRSFIGIDIGLLRRFQNKNEIAFVLSHEAAHTIAKHHAHLNFKSSDEGFTISKKPDHTVELEADIIGTIISERAGFDPVTGSDILMRVARNLQGSRSHPSVKRRLMAIKQAYALLKAGNEIIIGQ